MTTQRMRAKSETVEAFEADPLIGMLAHPLMLSVVQAGWSLLTAEQKATALRMTHSGQAVSPPPVEVQLDPDDPDAVDEPSAAELEDQAAPRNVPRAAARNGSAGSGGRRSVKGRG